uniref:TOG array regulator of axonemal microtubules 1 n=1 Tax=Poecilia formosa TaxID=48698 RepID=A0A096MBZ0_POEFO
LISQEIHDQLLDSKNYQNRTNGVEKLKCILSEVDIKSVPPGSVEEFINFLPRLLDDSNFKVLHGTLQVLNLLIQKLETGVDRFLKHIVFVALKALGDTRAVTRNEYHNVFQQLMKTTPPQQVLDLIIGNLKHKNSRVREDVLNIVMAAMLTHPRKDFNIPKLCFEVAPYLADNKKKVRHAALELFAVFDHYLDTGKKQPLMKALDMVELNEDAEGLMAAVHARRARRILPKLTSEGIVEYGLVVPKPGQWSTGQHASGADLDWVINGGRTSSARSYRTEHDSDLLSGYGSLGSLTDDPMFQRRIVSAGKGKNKLPWETLTDNELQQSTTPNGKSLEQVSAAIPFSVFYMFSYGNPANCCFWQNNKAKRYLQLSSSFQSHSQVLCFSENNLDIVETCPVRCLGMSAKSCICYGLRRSGSLNLDTDIFKNTNISDPDVGKQLFSRVSPSNRNPSVERTFSLPSNASAPGSFLLPSYPLATCTGGVLTPTLSRHHADSSLSMSNTWPNKRETSPQQQGTSPRREKEDTAKGDLFSVQSPRPLRASLVSSSSTSSFRRALSNTRATFTISPVQAHSHDNQRSNTPANQQPDSKLNLDFDSISPWQVPQEEEPLDMQEMLNSLRSLRNSAAKKRAKVTLSSPDPDSPDSAVQVDLRLDSPLQTSPVLTSSASESGLSSLSSAANSNFSNIKTRSGISNYLPSFCKRKCHNAVSLHKCSLVIFVSSPRSSAPSVGVVGQKVNYCNGTMKNEEEKVALSPPLVRAVVRKPIRALKIVKDFIDHITTLNNLCHFSHSTTKTLKSCRTTVLVSVLVISFSRMCGTTVSSNRPGAALLLEQGDLAAKPPTDPLAGIYSRQLDGDDSSHPEEPKEIMRIVRRGRDKTRAQNLEQFEDLSGRGDETRDKIRHRVRQMLSDSPTEECSHNPTSNPQHELCHATLRHKKNLSAPSELCPFSKPDLVLTQSFNLLNSEDWEKKIEGLMFLRSLAYNHADTLQSRLHEVCLCLIQEVKNLRSGVSRVAVCTLGDLYSHLQRLMDQELEGTVKALLQKAGESNTFIRQDVDGALDRMVQHCTPTRGIGALLTGGISHLNPVVRKCTAQHLANLLEKVGAARLLSGGKDLTERILPAITKLAQDSSQEARYFGRRMLLFLSSHPGFDKNLEKYIPTKDLQTVRDTVLTLRTKGLGEMPQDSQSARGRRSLPGSGTVRASSLNGEQLNQTNRESNSHYGCKHQTQSIADKNEYIKQISGLLGSKDFRERIKGIDQLVADCEHNPNMVVNSIFPVFDAFKARLQESNSKVNLYALESLQKITHLLKDSLSQVVNILVPAIVDNHLNSKNHAIYSAAIGALNALILNLDNTLLLQPFCTKAQFLSGKAKVDLIEKVAGLVKELYPRKPQVVEQKVLPLLWHLLGTSTHSGSIHGRSGSVRTATAKLCQALHTQMGSSLNECAASQPTNVQKGLNELLRTLKLFQL